MRLLVTRPEPDAAATVAALVARGHAALAAPAMRIVFRDVAPLQLDQVAAFAVTSRHAIAALSRSGIPTTLPVYSVGPATAEAARHAGFRDIRAAGGDAGALVERIAADAPFDGTVLYAAGADLARDLVGALGARGIPVDQVTVYAAEPVRTLSDAARRALLTGSVDGIVFYSARTVRLFTDLVAAEAPSALPFIGTAYCLSDAVAHAARVAGFTRVVAAESPTEDALFAALERDALGEAKG